MLSVLEPIAAACDLRIPAEHRLPVATVGAGAIAEYAHLPAYKKAGLDVRGIFDLAPERAATLAETHGIPRVYASLEELLDDDAVAVVDIAVVPWAQPEIARAAIDAGKHVLCQKPLAGDLDTAVELVERAEREGVQLAVNQQLRFDEGIAAARAMVDHGWVGDVTAMTFSIDITTDWSAWPWLVTSERLEIAYHSIHYFDAIRSFLGEPERVFCTGSRTPGQEPVGETRTMSTLVFSGDVRALVHVTHENIPREPEARFRIDGSEGCIDGTLGLLYDYPRGRPDTLSVFSRTVPTDGWLSYPVTTRWLPDAFAGPMGSLLTAIATGGTPATSARDNLRTLALLEALYESMRTGESRPVTKP